MITPTQLKETNLIFLEHDKLLKSDSIYKKQLKEISRLSLEIDSLYTIRIDSCSNALEKKELENEKLTKKYKKVLKSNRILIFGGSSIIAILLALLL